LITRQIGPGFIQQMQVQCPKCKGRGSSLKPGDECTSCRGEQIVKSKKVFEVVVERGARRGDHVAFVGEGDQVPGIALSGDIIVVFDEKPHAEFTRKGDNLVIERSVTLAEALTGFRLLVTHLDGRQLVLSPPAGTILDPTALYAVDREGMPVPKTGGVERGDLVVRFKVQYPDRIADEHRDTLRQILGVPAMPTLPVDYEESTLTKANIDLDARPRRKGDSDTEATNGPEIRTAQCAQQ